MNRCPSCGKPLPDGQEYCAPTKTMEDGAWGGNPTETKAGYVFAGCTVLRFDNLTKETTVRSGPRTGKEPKRLTDYQRAEKAWGKDCILSEFGPLPMEREIREGPSPYDVEWGDGVEKGSNTAGFMAGFRRLGRLKYLTEEEKI